jgi:hypothetical protein
MSQTLLFLKFTTHVHTVSVYKICNKYHNHKCYSEIYKQRRGKIRKRKKKKKSQIEIHRNREREREREREIHKAPLFDEHI